MKNLITSIFLFVFSVFSSNYANSQTVLDSLNNLQIVTTVPNTEHLKTISDIILISDNFNIDYISSVEQILKERYNCSINFVHNSIINDIDDPVFEVTTLDYNSYGVLFLNLSIIEYLYQKGILNEQINLYCKYTDISLK